MDLSKIELIEGILRPVEGEQIVIPPLEKTKPLADEYHIFDSIYTDEKYDDLYRVWNEVTGETEISVYELAKSGIIAQMFLSIDSDLSRLRLSQGQIAWLAKNQRKSLFPKIKSTALLLFQAKETLLVSGPCSNPSSLLHLWLYQIKCEWMWHPGMNVRIVVPRLKKAQS